MHLFSFNRNEFRQASRGGIPVLLAVCSVAQLLMLTVLSVGSAQAQFEAGTAHQVPTLKDVRSIIESKPDEALAFPDGSGTVEFWFRPGDVKLKDGKPYACLVACGSTVRKPLQPKKADEDVFDARYGLYLKGSTVVLQLGSTFLDVAEIGYPQSANYLAVVFTKDQTEVHHGVADVPGLQRSTFPGMGLEELQKDASTRIDPIWVGRMPESVTGVFEFKNQFGTLKTTTVKDSVGPFYVTFGGLRVWDAPFASTLFEQTPPIPWIYDEQSLQRRIEFPSPGVSVKAESPSINGLVAYSQTTVSGITIELNDPLEGSWVHEVPNDVYAPVRPTVRQPGKGLEFDVLGPVCSIHDRPVFTIVKETKFDGRYYVYRNGILIGYINGRDRHNLSFSSIDGAAANANWSTGILTINLDQPKLGRLKRPEDRGRGNRVDSGSGWDASNMVKAGASSRGYDLFSLNPVLSEGSDNGLKEYVFVEPTERGSEWFRDQSGVIAPLSFHVIYFPKSSVTWQNATFSSHKQFLESWGVRVGVKAGWGGDIGDAMGASTSVGISGGYGRELSKNEFRESMKSMSRSYAQLATLSMDRMQVRLHQKFVADVMSLASDLNEKNTDRLLDKYGTHYPHGVTYGGMLSMTETLNSEGLDEVRSENVEAGLSFRQGNVQSPNFEATVEGTYSKTVGKSRNVSKDKVKVEAVGGATTLTADGRSIQAGVALDTAVPILMDLRPIYELLSPLYFDDPEVYLAVRTYVQQRLGERARNAHSTFRTEKGFDYASDAEYEYSPPKSSGILHVKLDRLRADFKGETNLDFFGRINIGLQQQQLDTNGDSLSKLNQGPFTVWQSSIKTPPVGQPFPATFNLENRTPLNLATTKIENWGFYFDNNSGKEVNRKGGFTGITFRRDQTEFSGNDPDAARRLAEAKKRIPNLVADGEFKFDIPGECNIDLFEYYNAAKSTELAGLALSVAPYLFEDQGSDGVSMRCEFMRPLDPYPTDIANLSPQTLAGQKAAIKSLIEQLDQSDFDSKFDRQMTQLKSSIKANRTDPTIDSTIQLSRQLGAAWPVGILSERIALDDALVEHQQAVRRSNRDVDTSRFSAAIDAFAAAVKENKDSFKSEGQGRLNEWKNVDRLTEKTADSFTIKMQSHKHSDNTLELTLKYWWEGIQGPPPINDTGKLLAKAGDLIVKSHTVEMVRWPERRNGGGERAPISAMDINFANFRAMVFGAGADQYFEYPVTGIMESDDPNSSTRFRYSVHLPFRRRPVQAMRTWATKDKSYIDQSGDTRNLPEPVQVAVPIDKYFGGRVDAIASNPYISTPAGSRSGLFVFSGSKVLEVELQKRNDQTNRVIAPKEISERFPGLPENFQRGLDAAHPELDRQRGVFTRDRFVFYKGSQYLIYDLTKGNDQQKPRTMQSWPEEFRNGVDAAMAIGRHEYLIKGDKCAVKQWPAGTSSVKAVTEVIPELRMTRANSVLYGDHVNIQSGEGSWLTGRAATSERIAVVTNKPPSEQQQAARETFLWKALRSTENYSGDRSPLMYGDIVCLAVPTADDSWLATSGTIADRETVGKSSVWTLRSKVPPLSRYELQIRKSPDEVGDGPVIYDVAVYLGKPYSDPQSKTNGYSLLTGGRGQNGTEVYIRPMNTKAEQAAQSTYKWCFRRPTE